MDAGRSETGAAAKQRAEVDPLSRRMSPYSFGEKVRRALWMLFGQPAMRLSFHNWYGLRAAWLRLFGARIGRHVRIRPTVKIEQPWNLTIGDNSSVGDHAILYCLGRVTIGSNVSVSQYAHLCAGSHDYTRADLPLLKPPVTIEDDVWIAADVFVGPNVTIGRGAVIGARASVFKNLEGGAVYGGEPARALRERVCWSPSGEESKPDGA
ncbi:MAG: WcaF family extracellular polysaccharide biosynthesis acetyltransferase [Phycisphaerales bacterium]